MLEDTTKIQSSSSPASSAQPTAKPIKPTAPDPTSDDYKINGQFNATVYEGAVLAFKADLIEFEIKAKE